MIDIHTHILPSIDDGSDSIESTLNMIHEAYEAGFTDVITTSHYIDGKYAINKSERKLLINALREIVKDNIKLYNGAEAYITPELCSLYQNNTIPTLADSRYVLFELPLNSDVLFINKVLAELISCNYIPVIAHPERYKIVQKDINRAYSMIENGALLQCNYASFIGHYGHEAQKIAVKLLKKDKIAFLGSDAHRPESIYTRIGEILSKIEKTVGYEKVEQLTITNPQKILDNEYFD